MFKLGIIVFSLFFLSTVSLALAKSENNSQGNNQENKNKVERIKTNDANENQNENELDDDRGGLEATRSSQQICDPNFKWKNHGEYVSCVARLTRGREASEAARSNIGKKDRNGSESAHIRPYPRASGSATVSAHNPKNREVNELITLLQNLLKKFQNLFSF